MQIMPSPYYEPETSQSSYTSVDYSQEPSQATFSDDLDSALSDNSGDTDSYDKVWREAKDDYSDDMDEESSDKPYRTNVEAYSMFVPQPVRFVPAELESLSKALAADGVGMEALNAIKKMAGKVGGASLNELLGAVKQSMQGTNAELGDKDVALLQGLSNRLSPKDPDKLYNALRYSGDMTGLKELNNALTKMKSSLSKEEIGVIGKALNLSEDSIAGLTKKLSGLEGKPLTTKDINNLFGDAKAEIQTKMDASDKVQNSLEKHLKPIVNEAEKREELARQAQMRESKSVLQSRIMIEDTVVTRVLGDDLNRNDIQDNKKSEKSSSENKSISGNDRFTSLDGKKAVNITGSSQNILSDLDKKIVTKDKADPSSTTAEKDIKSTKIGENLLAPTVAPTDNKDTNALTAKKVEENAILLSNMGRDIVSSKNAENLAMTKNAAKTTAEKIAAQKEEENAALLSNKEKSAVSSKIAVNVENSVNTKNIVNADNTNSTNNVASAENSAVAVAEMLSGKTRTQDELKNPLENPLFARNVDNTKVNDKIFNENIENSKFLEKKEEASAIQNIKENFSDSGSKDNLKGDDRGKKGSDSTRYDYTFASSASSSTSTPTPTVPVSGAERLFTGGNASRHMNDIRDQVQNSILNMAKDGVQRIEVSLNPVELGQLTIALSIKNGEINATIQTEKPESASMINIQMDAIRAELENQGFKIEKLEVEVGVSNDNRQEWQGMDQHNSNRESADNAQYLERLRTISKLGSSESGTLAHNMQDTSSMRSHTANNAMTGLHIIA